MEIKVIRKQKLTECINPEHIYSIVPVQSLYGISLAIALKSDSAGGLHSQQYGSDSSPRGRAYFISLDRFTYHPCMYAAIPSNLYSSIVLVEKETEDGQRFMKAKITKPITF